MKSSQLRLFLLAFGLYNEGKCYSCPLTEENYEQTDENARDCAGHRDNYGCQRVRARADLSAERVMFGYGRKD